jgi:hypothetical protein
MIAQRLLEQLAPTAQRHLILASPGAAAAAEVVAFTAVAFEGAEAGTAEAGCAVGAALIGIEAVAVLGREGEVPARISLATRVPVKLRPRLRLWRVFRSNLTRSCHVFAAVEVPKGLPRVKRLQSLALLSPLETPKSSCSWLLYQQAGLKVSVKRHRIW